MLNLKQKAVSLTFILLLGGCFPSGIITRSGLSDDIQMIPSATRISRRAYNVYCGKETGYIEEKKAGTECLVSNEHSSYFLFHMFPVSPQADIYTAIAKAVQDAEGDSMISITFYREKHHYGILGTSIVYSVKGYVIRYTNPTGK